MSRGEGVLDFFAAGDAELKDVGEFGREGGEVDVETLLVFEAEELLLGEIEDLEELVVGFVSEFEAEDLAVGLGALLEDHFQI